MLLSHVRAYSATTTAVAAPSTIAAAAASNTAGSTKHELPLRYWRH